MTANAPNALGNESFYMLTNIYIRKFEPIYYMLEE